MGIIMYLLSIKSISLFLKIQKQFWQIFIFKYIKYIYLNDC
jgi:hypothetical protein